MKQWLVVGGVLVALVVAIAGTILLIRNSGEAGIDESAFKQMASQTICAERGIRVYAINERYVFFSRRGGCPDNYYAYRLYELTPANQLCEQHDSIAGPKVSCREGAPQELFETILANQDQPDLGLDNQYRVRPIQ